MRIGVLGTGTVGRTLAGRLAELSHVVTMGSRTADNPAAVAWAGDAGPDAHHGTFADAARDAEVVVNCTAGTASLAALGTIPSADLDGKVLLDVANALEPSGDGLPTLGVCNDDSLGEQIQRAHPALRVVKTLNTMNAAVMVAPDRVPGRHHVFLSGDDADAKDTARGLLRELGWPDDAMIDLGGIETARGTEMWLPLWLRLYGALGTPDFNLSIAR